MFTVAKAVANLSKVDGCVVLDRSLNVHGLGGKIQVDDNLIKDSGIQYADYWSKNVLPEDDIKAFGTRHQSAFRICKAIPHTIAYVISQDGDLRVFFSNDKFVFFIDALHAWSHNMPHW